MHNVLELHEYGPMAVNAKNQATPRSGVGLDELSGATLHCRSKCFLWRQAIHQELNDGFPELLDVRR